MRNNKLIRLFRKMSESELHRFTLFVHSPYFNKSTNCQKLLDEILKSGPKFTSIKLEKERLLKKVYPNAKSESSLTTDFSKLTQLLERFVIQEQIEQGSVSINKTEILSGFYEEKEEYRLVKSIQEKQLKHYEEHPFGDDAYYHQMFSQMPTFVRTDYPDKNKAFYFLGQGFTKYVFLRLLKDECHYKAINNRHQIKHSLPLSKALLPLLEKEEYKYLLEVPLIKLYYAYYKIYDQTRSLRLVNDFLVLLHSNLSFLNKNDTYNLFTAAINICYQDKERTDLEVKKEVLKIYKLAIEYDVLLKRNILGLNRYMNIVSAAAHSGDFDWAYYFIDKYIVFIKKSLPVNEIKLSGKGIIAFYEKDYEKATNFFIKCKQILPHTQELPKKTMELRCLYELKIWKDVGGISRFESLIKRFERYLLNYPKEISVKRCESYKRFFQLTAMLFKYNAKMKTYSKEKILKEIKAAKCMNKDWLMDKYHEL